MSSPLISIIIPVYNAEKYLCLCLDSVLTQTYTNWECLLVDDGSKDSSGIICDEYAKTDSRFKVYHKENGGVSSARNLGLKEAKGEYIIFLDSDDRMKPTLLQTCISKIQDADLLIFSFERFGCRTDKMILSEVQLQCANECHDYLYELKEDCSTSEFFCFPWNKLYKRDLLVDNRIQFPTDISLREDEIFSYRYLPHVHSLVAISDILIEYNDEPSGLSAKPLVPSKSLALAAHLIHQTSCVNSVRSKNILFFRAMVYMEDALINTTGISGKIKIAKSMIAYYNERTYPTDSNICVGKCRHMLETTLSRNSTVRVLLLASLTKLSRLYRIHIKKDANLKRWGTNV